MQTTPFLVPASRLLTDVEFCAWLAQAEPGETIEYHAGALAMDRLRGVSRLPRAECDRVNALADRAFAAAGRDLVHLVQRRLGPDRFSYRAIARPKPRGAQAALAGLLLADAA